MSRRQPLSTLGAASLQNQAPVLAGHSSPKAVSLCAPAVVRLESALRHRNEFSLKTKTLRLTRISRIRQTGFTSIDPLKPVTLLGPIRGLPSAAFNNGVYQNLTTAVQNSDWTNGDQRELFYSPHGLDHSETSVLVSARFESRRPVNN